MENHGYALSSFKPVEELHKEEAVHYLRSLLNTRYMSDAWSKHIDDDTLLYQFVEIIKDYGYQLSLNKKEGKK